MGTTSNSSILLGGIAIIVLAAVLVTAFGETLIQWLFALAAIYAVLKVAQAMGSNKGRGRRRGR